MLKLLNSIKFEVNDKYLFSNLLDLKYINLDKCFIYLALRKCFFLKSHFDLYLFIFIFIFKSNLSNIPGEGALEAEEIRG